jgi:hypothetical protein
MRARRLLLAVLALSTCRFEAALPPGLVITCDTAGICPEGYRCQQGIGRCVPEAQWDDVPPAIVAGDTITIVPGPGAPLLTPSRLSRSSSAIVRFQVTERLGREPELTAPHAECRLDRARSELDFEFRCAAVGDDLEVEDLLTVRLSDPAGNEATAVLSSRLAIDTRPPTAPDVETPGRIVYERAPWGRETSAGEPDFRVLAGAGAAEPGALVRFRTAGFARGEVSAAQDGSFAVTLLPLDEAALEASAMDVAGNVSPWVLVRDARWIVSFSKKERDSSTRNPHLFGTVAVLGDAVARDDLVSRGASDGIDRVGGKLLTVWGGGRWERFSDAIAGAPVTFAWDDARRLGVQFGMHTWSQLGRADHLLAWNGRGWRELRVEDPEGDGSPHALLGSQFVYDETERRLVLLSGARELTPSRETWTWTGRSWRRLADGPARLLPAAFYQRKHRRVVVSGGASAIRSDTDWEIESSSYALSGGEWVPLSASLPVAGAGVARDPRRDEAWAYGGRLADGGVSSMLYRFVDDTWKTVPQSAGPPALVSPIFVWDESRDVGVLIGGTANQELFLETWEWDRSKWRQVEAGVPFADHAVFGTELPVAGLYDPARGHVIVSSGLGTVSRYVAGSWQSEPAASSRLTPRPAPRLACAARVGGCVTVDPPLTYQLTSGGWRQIDIATFDAGPGSGRLVWDSARSELVLVGPSESLTWNGDHDAGWSLIPDAGTSWFGEVALTDTPHGPLLVQNNRGALRWMGTGWDAAPGVPYNRTRFDWLTATHSPEGAVLLALHLGGGGSCFGWGEAPEASAWLFDGGWTRGATPPSTLAAISDDPYRGGMVTFGGINASLNANAFLYQTGPDGGWELVPIADPELDGNPAPRVQAELKWDATRRAHILMGGSSALGEAPNLTDTWLFSIIDERPAARVRIDLEAARLATRMTPIRLLAHARVGGSGAAPDGGTVHGARWRVFRGSSWADHTTVPSPAAVGSVAPAEFELSDAEALQRVVVGQRSLELELFPEGTNGAGRAGLSVDYVEVSLEYRQ